jgi:long-chain acyl-CoA synthetase
MPARQMAMLQSCDILWASPAQLRLLLRAGGELPKLAHLIVGGSKLDDALRGALGQRTGARICEFYGAAEASFITLSQDDLATDTVGVPYPGVDLALGDDGALWVRSPYLFQRYAGADKGAARWDGDWLSVGEQGQIRGGRLFLLGREGRMVTVADQNVFPEQIETQIMAMAGVAQAAVLPRHDALRGVHLVAVAQGDSQQESVILAQLRGQMGPLRAPKAMIWLSNWPMLPSGKTDLVALQRAVDAAGDIWR